MVPMVRTSLAESSSALQVKRSRIKAERIHKFVEVELNARRVVIM